MAGTPKAVTEKLDRLRREAAAQATQTPESAETVTPTPEPEPAQSVVQEPVIPEAAPVVTEPVKKTDYEQQYRTAQGIADRAGEEIKALRAELESRKGENQKLLDAVDRLVAATPAPIPEPEKKPEPVAPLVTVQDLTDEEDDILGGKDGTLAHAVRKLVTADFAVVAGTLESRMRAVEEALTAAITGVQTKVDTVVQTEAQRKAASFMETLTGRVKNAEQIHHSADFQNWLGQQFDGEYARTPLWDVYAAALNQDANTVASIQKRYLKERTGGTTATAQTQPAAPAASPLDAVPEALRDQIAPARSVSAGAPGETSATAGNAGNTGVTIEDVVKYAEKVRTRGTWIDGMPATREKYEELKQQYYQTIKQQEAVARRK